MFDNQLIAAVRQVLQVGLLARNLTNVDIQQNNQPTLQGVNSTPLILFSKIGNKHYGFLRRADDYDLEASTMVHTEEQLNEVTFQVDALITQDPVNVSGMTASDLVNIAALILMSDAGRETLQAQGIGVLRVTEVRNLYMKNDQDVFQASPSFDVTLTSKYTTITDGTVLKLIETGIYRV